MEQYDKGFIWDTHLPDRPKMARLLVDIDWARTKDASKVVETWEIQYPQKTFSSKTTLVTILSEGMLTG